MRLALDKAAAHGLAVVSVFNSHHFGAAGIYAAMAAERGMIGLVASSARTVALVPTFGAEPVLGTNPLAFAAPAGRNPPVLFDIATSVVAANKVKVYALNGKDIPPGWVVDGDGAPVTDAIEALRYAMERPEGGLNPIGGTREMGSHKGYGRRPPRPDPRRDSVRRLKFFADPQAGQSPTISGISSLCSTLPLSGRWAISKPISTPSSIRSTPRDAPTRSNPCWSPATPSASPAPSAAPPNVIPIPESLRRQIRDLTTASGALSPRLSAG